MDTALLGSYKAAKSAGFTNIDVYFFPCMLPLTGPSKILRNRLTALAGTETQTTGVACKSPKKQVTELEDYLSKHEIKAGMLWLDIEPTRGECNSWNLGASANKALAKEYVSIIKSSSHKWGVYANGNQWSGMFGSRSVDIASDLPLWAVQFDRTPGVNTVDTFMGRWTKAYAKQYWLRK